MEGRNPFKGYQVSKVSARITVIESYLAVLRRTRGTYQYVTDLAKAVAEQVTLVEGATCDYSTLLRNRAYKSLLLSFMAGTPGIPSANTCFNPVAETQIRLLNLDVQNAKKDNARLKAYILELESSAETVPSLRNSEVPPLPFSEDSQMRIALENELATANKALWLVIEWYKDLIAVDRERDCIIDLAALRQKNTIVDQVTARPFIAWMRKNSGIG